jgi:hypothetical protein
MTLTFAYSLHASPVVQKWKNEKSRKIVSNRSFSEGREKGQYYKTDFKIIIATVQIHTLS